MSNLESLRHGIDKMIVAIEQMQGIALSGPLFKLHLFTEQEQAELQTFIDVLSLKCFRSPTLRIDLSELTDQELNTLLLWLRLERALDSEDQQAVEQYRRALSWSYDSLLETFLALDASSIPEFDQAPTVEYERIIYTLYRTAFRADKARIERAIAANRLNGSELQKMRLWCDTFAAQAAAA